MKKDTYESENPKDETGNIKLENKDIFFANIGKAESTDVMTET